MKSNVYINNTLKGVKYETSSKIHTVDGVDYVVITYKEPRKSSKGDIVFLKDEFRKMVEELNTSP